MIFEGTLIYLYNSYSIYFRLATCMYIRLLTESKRAGSAGSPEPAGLLAGADLDPAAQTRSIAFRTDGEDEDRIYVGACICMSVLYSCSKSMFVHIYTHISNSYIYTHL